MLNLWELIQQLHFYLLLLICLHFHTNCLKMFIPCNKGFSQVQLANEAQEPFVALGLNYKFGLQMQMETFNL